MAWSPIASLPVPLCTLVIGKWPNAGWNYVVDMWIASLWGSLKCRNIPGRDVDDNITMFGTSSAMCNRAQPYLLEQVIFDAVVRGIGRIELETRLPHASSGRGRFLMPDSGCSRVHRAAAEEVSQMFLQHLSTLQHYIDWPRNTGATSSLAAPESHEAEER